MKAKTDIHLSSRTPDGQKSDGSSYRALVVDDSIFVTKQLSQILTSEGFEVADTAGDGEEAVQKYKEMSHNIDFVTMDITMPKMDGITALEKIMEYDRDAKVIMVSAIGSQDAVKKALMAGAKNYIVKPLDRKKVLERIMSSIK